MKKIITMLLLAFFIICLNVSQVEGYGMDMKSNEELEWMRYDFCKETYIKKFFREEFNSYEEVRCRDVFSFLKGQDERAKLFNYY